MGAAAGGRARGCRGEPAQPEVNSGVSRRESSSARWRRGDNLRRVKYTAKSSKADVVRVFYYLYHPKVPKAACNSLSRVVYDRTATVQGTATELGHGRLLLGPLRGGRQHAGMRPSRVQDEQGPP